MYTLVSKSELLLYINMSLQERVGAEHEALTRRAAAFVINVREQCHLSQVLPYHASVLNCVLTPF